MIFALFMLAAAGAAVWGMVVFVGVWAGLGFAALLYVIYRAATYDSAPDRPMTRHSLNAFQQPLAEGPAPLDRAADRAPNLVPGLDTHTRAPRGGYRNRSYRKAMARKAQR